MQGPTQASPPRHLRHCGCRKVPHGTFLMAVSQAAHRRLALAQGWIRLIVLFFQLPCSSGQPFVLERMSPNIFLVHSPLLTNSSSQQSKVNFTEEQVQLLCRYFEGARLLCFACILPCTLDAWPELSMHNWLQWRKSQIPIKYSPVIAWENDDKSS